MKKYQKILLILGCIILILTGLTFYANRFLLPTMIKNIAITEIKKITHRDISIESIHFNWVKGLIVDKVVLYQKENPKDVLLSIQRLSMGVLYFPGLKEQTLSFPFITVEKPWAHFIRQDQQEWNISDLIALATSPKTDEKPSAIKIAVGAINIQDGHIQVDDRTQSPTFSETFHPIDLNVSLSYEGIKFDFTTQIPKKKGILAAKGTMWPLTQSVDMQAQLKNIDTASYLNLFIIDGLKIQSGLIQSVNAHVIYNDKGLNLKGDFNLDHLNADYNEYHVQGQILAQKVELNHDTQQSAVKGDFSLNDLSVKWPSFSLETRQGLNIKINDSSLQGKDIFLDGSLRSKDLVVTYTDTQIKSDLTVDDIKLRQDNNSTQLLASVIANQLKITQNDQLFESQSFNFKPLRLIINPQGQLEVTGDLKTEKMHVHTSQHDFSTHLSLTDIKATWQAPSTFTLFTKLNADDYHYASPDDMSSSGNLKANHLLVKMQDQHLKVGMDCEFTKSVFNLTKDQVITASPQIEMTVETPLNDTSKATYEGSITFADAKVSGFPYTPLDGIGLDADFKTNDVTINAFTVNLLDSSLRASGNITDFNNPQIQLNAEANDINLGQLKNYLGNELEKIGVSVDGLASIKLKYQGPLKDYLTGDIQSLITLNKTNIQHNPSNQKLKNISGIIDASGQQLIFREIKGYYLEQPYTLTGEISDFKNPSIKASLKGELLQLDLNGKKEGEIVQLQDLSGTYQSFPFKTNGQIRLAQDQAPDLDLNFETTLDLTRLPVLLSSKSKEEFEQLKLEGVLNIHSKIKGSITKDYDQISAETSVKAPTFAIMGYHLSEIQLSSIYKQNKFDNITLDANIYGGTLHAVSTASIKDKLPYDLALKIDKLKIEKFISDTPISKDIRGLFDATLVLEGQLVDPLQSKGKLNFAITEGYLNDIPIIKSMFNPISNYVSNIIFTESSANFTLEDKTAKTNNLIIAGQAVTFMSKGTLNTDLYADHLIEAPPELNQNSLIPVNITNQLKFVYKGKITDPKTKVMPKFSTIAFGLSNLLPKEVVKNAPSDILDTGLNILDGFLGGGKNADVKSEKSNP